jgi:transglutaminase-like putative cysteine protease
VKRLIFAALCLTVCQLAQAQNYGTGLISKDLLSHASAIVRADETTITIKDADNVIEHVKHVITVLNKNGVNDARLVLYYNKMQHIKSVKGIIYDDYGKPVSKFGESDFKDQNDAHDFSLFEDIRVKYYTPSVTSYPYTVEYNYDLQSNQSVSLASWIPARNTGIAVENSTFTVACKPNLNIRYKEMAYPGQVQTGTDDKGLKTYTWKLSNVPARRDEPYSPDLENTETRVHVAPQSFSYGGIAGNYDDWNGLGKWIYDKLLTGRTQLSPETVRRMQELTADIADPKEKAKKIYEYMQQKSRYVSIQIGIGNEQPFPASEVDELGYGDCKGLVNYTQALLKAVGVESYYCVVTAGSFKESFLKDFASMDQGNHIILCLPLKSDTTWAECTSKTIPFGFLGNFTDDRLVLACTAQGGKLMHTPKYTAEDNTENRKADFVLTADGKLNGNINTKFSGTQYDHIEAITNEPYTEQLKHVKSFYQINNIDVESYKLEQHKNIKPEITELLKFNADEYGTIENDNLRFMVNSLNRMNSAPREVRNRSNPVYVNRGYTDEEVVTYILPAGYHPDRTLLDVNLHKDFGNYIAKVTLIDNQLVYTRKLQMIDGTYDKQQYSDLVDFYQAVVDADNYSITMIKNK